MGSTRLIAPLAAACGLAVSVARAQVIDWDNPAGGVWNDPLNWNPNNVPNLSTEMPVIGTPGAYTVTLNISPTIGGFSIANPTATLALANGTFLVSGAAAADNAGTILVNSVGGTSGTFVRFDVAGTLGSPGGQVILNANSGNPDTSSIQANNVAMTNAAGHTIRGTGRIRGTWHNNGMVIADVGGGTLEMLSGARTNNDTLRATGGGTLLLNSNATTQGPGGRIVADGGGTVTLNGCVTSAGDIDAANGGVLNLIGINTWNGVNPFGSFAIPNSAALLIASPGLTHSETITINPTAGASTTYVRFDAAGTLSGSGVVVLNANAGNLDTALVQANNVTMTHGPGRTLRGSGRLLGSWVNNGTIQADVSGRTLELSGARTNTNLMRATGGATLLFNGSTTTQTGGGRIVADGGTVALNGVTTTGGLLELVNGGLLALSGTNTWNGVSPAGSFAIPNNVALLIASPGLTHSDTITINPAAGTSPTYLRFDAAGTFGGSGVVVLNANAANPDTAYVQANNVTMTHGPGRTLRGAGRLVGTWINNGTIQADVSGRTLEMVSARTNNNIMRATGGGTLLFSGSTTTQGPGARIVADGGTVALNAVTTTGGLLELVNGGQLVLSGINTWNGVSPSGSFAIPNNAALLIASPGLTHNDTITINPTAGTSSTYLRFDAVGTLDGNGVVVLNANANLDTAYVQANNVSMTHGPGRTLRGTGRLLGSWINNGTVQADVSGRTLEMIGGRTNNHIMRAAGGGTLLFNGSATTQGPGARIVADGGTVSLNNVTTTGGFIDIVNQGHLNLVGTNTWNGVTASGSFDIPSSAALVVTSPGLTHSDTITINPTAGSGTTFLRFDAAGTLGGNGTIRLNATPANLDTAYVQANNVTLTHSPTRLLTGIGRLFGANINQGTITPGGAGATGTIGAQGPLTLAQSSVVRIELGGVAPGSYDSISGSGPKTLGGRLEVSLIKGHVPPNGAFYDIIVGSAVTGTFSQVVLPPGPPRLIPIYLADRVRLVTCYPNCDGSTGTPTLNVNDFICFQSRFAAAQGLPHAEQVIDYANCDGSTAAPALNVNDFVCFQAAFAAGCP